MLGLELVNYFGSREISLIVVSLGTLVWLMVGTGEGSFFGLSLGLPLGYPPESTNIGSELSSMLMGGPLGLWFGS